MGLRGKPVVAVVDDDSESRAALAALLKGAGYAAAEASSGWEAMSLARGQQISLVLLEVALPGLSGYEVCRQLRVEFGPWLPVMFVSGVRTESFDRVAGLLIGADDYMVKPFAADELLARVRRLVDTSRGREAYPVALTPREREVLHLLGLGMGQPKIASELRIAPKTVGAHLEHIFRKLGVHNQAQAVAAAYRHDGALLTRPYPSVVE